MNLFDRIVAVSEAVKQLTERCGVRATRISVIWNSADEESFRPRFKDEAKKRLGMPLEKDIILFVGRLAPIKGLRYLLKAMPLVLDKQKALLVIVGDGPDRDSLEHFAKVSDLQSCVFFVPGNMTPEELALYYNAADVFVLPSLYEGHSVALLEAMASGLPIVATDVGGNRESVVNGANGFLVKHRDYLALAKALSTILANKKLSVEFSKKSLMLYFNSFSETSQTRKYLWEYDKLLTGQSLAYQQASPAKMH